MKAAMYAIIKKDFRIIASNRRLFPALFIVPLVLTIVLPSIFVITIHFVPDDPDITKLLSLLPETARMESLELTLSGMILNYILPIFFLIIPIMTASIMAASAFVGEKERHTLETLLYCPLTLKQIFQAKVWASFLLSIRSIEIEVFQKFSNSLDFDTNSGPRYAVDFRNFSDVVSLVSVHGDDFQIFGFQSFECSKQLLVLNLTNPCKTAFSFVVSICHGNRILIA